MTNPKKIKFNGATYVHSDYIGAKEPVEPEGPKVDKAQKIVPRPTGNHAPVAPVQKSVPSTPVKGKGKGGK